MEEPYLVFDLETQRDADSVGGWNYIADMKMSVGVLWDSRTDKFLVYLEDKVEQLIDQLLSGIRVIGFNHIHFDYRVLSGYRKIGTERDKLFNDLKNTNNLDLLVDLKNRLGHRLKLDTIAKATLNAGKSADGLQALIWYRQYQETQKKEFLEKIINYCVKDVAVTRDVYQFGMKNNKVQYESNQGGIREVQVNWPSSKEVSSNSQNHQLSLFD